MSYFKARGFVGLGILFDQSGHLLLEQTKRVWPFSWSTDVVERMEYGQYDSFDFKEELSHSGAVKIRVFEMG